MLSKCTHTHSFFIYVTDIQKHSSPARVWAANAKMYFDTGMRQHAQKHVHQVQHTVNRSISKINKYMSFHLGHKLTQHDISFCSEEHLGKRKPIYTYWNILGFFFFFFFLALVAIFAVSWSQSSEAFSLFKVKIFFLLDLTGSQVIILHP